GEARGRSVRGVRGRAGRSGGGGAHSRSGAVSVGRRGGRGPPPPVWMPVGSPGSASEAAARGITIGVLNTGWARTPAIYEAYRKTAAEAGREMRLEKLAHMALVRGGPPREGSGCRAGPILRYTPTRRPVA